MKKNYRNYEAVVQELKIGFLHEKLWAKAVEKSLGKRDRAKSLYVELRAQRLKKEETQNVRRRIR